MIGDIIGKFGLFRVYFFCIYISLLWIMLFGEIMFIIEDFDGKIKKFLEELSNKYVEWYNEVLLNFINENLIIVKFVEKKSIGKICLFILFVDVMVSI